jgi:chlorobactene glucosyltransferase
MTILSAIVLFAWLMSLGWTILNLLLLPRLSERRASSSPRVSVIIPARNEEKVIERTVRALLAQTYPDFEVIVVDDRSTDRTSDILAAIEDPHLVVVHGAEKPDGWLGKPWALYQGSQRASGDLLLFVDADLIYRPGTLDAAVAHMEERGVAMLALLPHFELHGFWENAGMPQLALTIFTYMPSWLADRYQVVALAIGGGPGNLVRRDDYAAIGGHEPLRDAVVDDVALARRMRASGRRTEMVRADRFVSLHMYEGAQEIIDGFTKNCFAIFGRRYMLALSTTVLVVIFHLLPYVLACFGDPLAIATVVVISITRVILFRALRYPLWNALLLHPAMIAMWGWIFIRSMWLTGVRRQLHWRGRTYDAAETRFGHER